MQAQFERYFAEIEKATQAAASDAMQKLCWNCRDLPESSCALVIRVTLLCTSWPPGLCPLARATGLCMALLIIFLFSVCLCFVVSNLRDAIWVAFSMSLRRQRCHLACAPFGGVVYLGALPPGLCFLSSSYE